MTIEPILKENPQRFSLFPIIHNDLWKLAKDAESALWVANEIDFGGDINDWNTLDKDEQYFIKNILAFFAGSDGIILENLMSTFNVEVQYQEARAFYSVQIYIEFVHSEVYSKMIDTLVKDKDEKNMLFNAIETIPCVNKKAEWAKKWMDPESNTFGKRILGFIIVEGLFFSGSFCSIFWLKSRGKMKKALAKSNELIARDEMMHAKFGITIYNNHIVNKVSYEDLIDMFQEAVDIETEFICESLPCRLIGMNSDLMIQYIKFVADTLIKSLGYKKIYNVTNPFPFMNNMASDGKTNFFEERVTEYKRAASVSESSKRKIFTSEEELDDDF